MRRDNGHSFLIFPSSKPFSSRVFAIPRILFKISPLRIISPRASFISRTSQHFFPLPSLIFLAQDVRTMKNRRENFQSCQGNIWSAKYDAISLLIYMRLPNALSNS